MQPNEVDITGVSIRLNELRSRFDRIIRDGETFDNIKKIYFEIKELECHQNAMQWNPRDNSAERALPEENSRSSRSKSGRYKHVSEPPPLL